MKKVIEIKEDVKIVQEGHDVVLEKGDKIKLITEGVQYYDPKFYGTSRYYKSFSNVLNYTDSIKYFADKFEAYWLIDLIATLFPKYKNYMSFIIIEVDVDANRRSAVINFRKDSNKPPFLVEKVDVTDLKQSVKFYLIDRVLMFPSDY